MPVIEFTKIDKKTGKINLGIFESIEVNNPTYVASMIQDEKENNYNRL